MAEDIKIKYINIGSENLPVKSAEKDKKVSEVINILAEKPLNIKANEADDEDGQDLLYIWVSIPEMDRETSLLFFSI